MPSPSRAADLTELFEPHERSPGMRTYFGRQVDSQKQSSPAYGFGSGTRDAQKKVYASRDQSKATPGNVSQGPVYTLPDSIGKQADSRKITPPAFGFGSSTRSKVTSKSKSAEPGPGAYKAPPSVAFQQDSRKKNSETAVFGTSTRDQKAKEAVQGKEQEVSMYGKESPSPNLYSLRGSIGKQNLSNKKNLPSTRIGTAPRFPSSHTEKEDSPGAGTYKQPDSVGRQINSRKKNASCTSFGTSTRDNAAKVFISHEHGKTSSGASPGPATSDPYNGLGQQRLSNRKTARSVGFGTSKRPDITGNAKKDNNPGPGSYWI